MVRSGDGGTQSQTNFELSWSLIKWLESLQKSDQMFYNMMMIEIWSIAQTMDEISPGFWADYMKNRQAIMRQQIQERKQKVADAANHAPKRKSSILRRTLSPFELTLDSPNQADSQLVSLFSQTFEQELPKVQRSVQFSPPTAIELGQVASLGPNVNPPQKTDQTNQDDAHNAGQPSPIEASKTFGGSDETASTIEARQPESTAQPVPPKPTAITWLLALPHLIHPPEVRVFPSVFSEIPLPNPEGFKAIVMACWLTRRFLVPVPLGESNILVLQRLESVELKPGESIVCQLGFRIKGVIPPVKVQLTKSLQQVPGLVSTWVDQTSTTRPATPENPNEAAIQLSNQGAAPLQLKAGQAFCRLEFRHYELD